MALMCISLMSGDLEHHFMYLLAIWSCLENCELSSSAHILPGLFGLFVIELNEIMVRVVREPFMVAGLEPDPQLY